MKVLRIAVLLTAFQLCASHARAAFFDQVNATTFTLTGYKLQKISFARHGDIYSTATVGTANIVNWLNYGSSTIAVQNSTSDVACPVQFEPDGVMKTFNDFGGHTFLIIESTEEITALNAVPQRVKFVHEIEVCGDVTATPEVPIVGCAYLGTSTTTYSHIVMQTTRDGTNPLYRPTLVHEFGHNVGNPDINCPSCSESGSARRIMNRTNTDDLDEVTSDECQRFKR